jgi:uncharacterized protein YjbI with pentapeptide repeats
VDLSFAAAVLVTLAVAIVALLWLLDRAEEVPPGKERATTQADAVKTAAAIALGTGGAAYLLLAYRRQRLDEVDTRERRITELYTKAVEELGHEKAPVRLGALYSLERLGQNNPEHRHTVVAVFCAYLRMPYAPPAASELGGEGGEEAPSLDSDQIRAPRPVQAGMRGTALEELQVRKAVQQILVDHLRPSKGKFKAAQSRRASPRRAFWPGTSLDLTGAVLVDANFHEVLITRARLDGATFKGPAQFDRATFQADAEFNGATFQDIADFNGATFQADAEFNRAVFQGFVARFYGTIFQGFAWFDRANFQGGTASFDGATFESNALFGGATFQGGPARFNGAIFQGNAGFAGATFLDPDFTGARVLHLVNPAHRDTRSWPHGYAVRPDPADPTRGTLIYAAEEPELAVPVSDRPTDNGLGTSQVDRQDR